MIDDPLSIRYHLERAWHLAQSGRPGPCWLDIPVDVQAASIDPATPRLRSRAEDDEPSPDECENPSRLKSHCREVLERISNAKRP